MVNPIPPDRLGHYLNDMIARALAGVPTSARPIFLKLAYTGPAAMAELANYDPHLVPGILGGSAGTTYDAFRLLADAKAHGARAALYGRKIVNSEHELTFIQFLRWIADGEIGPEEAVRAYHGVLQGLGIAPKRPLDDDLKLTDTAISYGGTTTLSIPKRPEPRPQDSGKRPAAASFGEAYPIKPDGSPDFAKMTSEQRLAYHRARLDKSIG